MQDFKTVAIYAARIAGTILEKHFPRVVHPERCHRFSDNWMTGEERRAERIIVKTIQGVFPAHAILTEESGWPARRSTPYTWIIDPLDGMTNYAHGVPVFCVSIALEVEGRIVLGVVYNPFSRDMFVAEEGQGSRLNGEEIRVSDVGDLDRALLASGFGYDTRASREQDPAHFAAFATKAQGFRRTGAVSLDLCYVACGRFDGFWERHLDPWDTAAGSLIVREAGGKATDYYGDPFSIFGTELLASNGRIHTAMQEVLVKPGDLRKDPRAPITMKISYQSCEVFKTDYVRNLSKGGVFIQTTSPLPRGTLLKVVLPFADPPRVIEAEGVVAWVQGSSQSGGGMPGMGVQFVALDPDDRAFLDQVVAAMLDQPAPPHKAPAQPVAAAELTDGM